MEFSVKVSLKPTKITKIWSLFSGITKFGEPKVPSQMKGGQQAIYQNVGDIQEILLRKFKNLYSLGFRENFF
jgi:hypothetical protein